LEGVNTKRENRALKENIISPELLAHCMALNAQDQLIRIVGCMPQFMISCQGLMRQRQRMQPSHTGSILYLWWWKCQAMICLHQ